MQPLLEHAWLSFQVVAVVLDCFFLDLYFYDNKKCHQKFYSWEILTDWLSQPHFWPQIYLILPFNKTLEIEVINAFALNKCGLIFLAVVSA